MATKIFVSEQQENTSASAATRSIHVVTLTPFYPLAGDDAAGCFIAEPLAHVAAHQVTSSVIAVQAFYRRRPLPEAAAPRAHWCMFPSLPGAAGLASAGKLLGWSLLARLRDLHRRGKVDLIHAHSG